MARTAAGVKVKEFRPCKEPAGAITQETCYTKERSNDMKRGPVTPKGFRDIEPELAKKRREVINEIADVLESFGFVPVETPTLEFAETLLGKYGEEEKLIYQFTDRGGRNLALRYDLTVPLARFVANNLGLIEQEPFRRYQIGQVFRGDNPQKGRFREFTQFDFDTVGSDDINEDAKVIATAIFSARKVGLTGFQMKINDKKFISKVTDLAGIDKKSEVQVLREIDKVGKKPQADIDRTISSFGNSYVSTVTVSGTISNFKEYKKPETLEKLSVVFESSPWFNKEDLRNQLVQASQETELKEIFEEPESYKKLKEILLRMGVKDNEIAFERKLVRGLDYYTGFIFELKATNKLEDLSIGGGGRYDNLIGMFVGRQIPAVGFSFGLDRLIEVLSEKS